MKSCMVAVAALMVASQVMAAGSTVATEYGRFTEIAEQEAAVMGDHVVFFVKGYGRDVQVGDTLICGAPGQDMTVVADMFRSSPFTSRYASTMDRLARRGKETLDAGCIIDADPVQAVALFKRLGGTLSPLEYPMNMPVNQMVDQVPESQQPGDWSARVEWWSWLAANDLANVDPTTLPPTLRKEWIKAIKGGELVADHCTDVTCVNKQISLTTTQLELIKKRAGL